MKINEGDDYSFIHEVVGLLDTIQYNLEYNIIKVFGSTPRNRISASDFRMVANTLTNDTLNRFGGQYIWSDIHPAKIISSLADLFNYRPDLVTPDILKNTHDYITKMIKDGEPSGKNAFTHLLEPMDDGTSQTDFWSKTIQKNHYFIGKYFPDIQVKLTDQMGYYSFRDFPEEAITTQEAANNFYNYLLKYHDFPTEGLDNVVNHFPQQFVNKKMIDYYLSKFDEDDKISALEHAIISGNNDNNPWLRYCYNLLRSIGEEHLPNAIAYRDDYHQRLEQHKQEVAKRQGYQDQISTDPDADDEDDPTSNDQANAELDRIKQLSKH
jgi:hypothetical protein